MARELRQRGDRLARPRVRLWSDFKLQGSGTQPRLPPGDRLAHLIRSLSHGFLLRNEELQCIGNCQNAVALAEEVMR
jgi:hypothetical protein